MADIDLKTETPDATLPSTGFLFGADSQAAASPSVYSTQAVATALLGSTSLTGATITADAPVLNLAQTWNNAAVTFTGMRFNVPTDSSAAGSLLMDLQVGGVSEVTISKAGTISASTLSLWTGGSVGSGAQGLFLSSTSAQVGSTGRFSFGSTTNAGATQDTFITRRGAANLQLGAADAAAPVAQTLSVQSVVAGTSNTAGANLTITGSQGTGTGAGGSIIFQVAPAGSSGTAQNALATALTINSSSQLLFAAGSAVTPSISFSGSTNTGLFEVSGGVQFSSGGSNVFGVRNEVRVNSTVAFGWSSGTPSATGLDVLLWRDAANTLALRNGTNAQELRVYKTTTGTVYKALRGDNNLIKIAGESFTDGSGANAGTLTNSPVTGNPTKWIPIDDNGTTRYIPAW